MARRRGSQAARAVIPLLLAVSSALADDASVAIDPMPQRYHLTVVDRNGMGHRTSGEWDSSTALSIAWHAGLSPRPLLVGLRAEGVHRREAGLFADEGTLSLEVGAAADVSSRASLRASVGYGSGCMVLHGNDLASDLRHRIATVSLARATVGVACALGGGAAIGLDAGCRYVSLSDRWTRGGIHGSEFGPVLAATAIWRW